MAEYKITWKSQLDHLRMLIFFTFICYLIIRAGVYFWGGDDLETGLVSVGAWYLIINLIPQAVLHLRYLYLNQGCLLTFSETKREIIITKGNKSETFGLSEITYIENYKMAPYYENRGYVLPFTRYNYNVIHLRNGNRFVITSLMAKDLDLPIESKRKIKSKVFFFLSNLEF